MNSDEVIFGTAGCAEITLPSAPGALTVIFLSSTVSIRRNVVLIIWPPLSVKVFMWAVYSSTVSNPSSTKCRAWSAMSSAGVRLMRSCLNPMLARVSGVDGMLLPSGYWCSHGTRPLNSSCELIGCDSTTSRPLRVATVPVSSPVTISVRRRTHAIPVR